jgi:hypothetical protein
MSSTLQSKPILNPHILDWASSASTAAKTAAAKVNTSGGIGWVAVAVLVAFFIGLLVWYFRASSVFETPSNIGRIAREQANATSHYSNSVQGRKGLRAYLQELKASGVPDGHLCLTNFYISTVNAAGLFSPGVDAIASPMAIRAAADGGARGFVFDLWPDLTPGAQFAPVVQIIESGSLWRRISLNTMPFVTMMKQLVQQCYEVSPNPGSEDPVILYLRFRGKPRNSTYTIAAKALQSTMENYRMDSPYNNCRSQDAIFSTPMTSLFKKMIIMSNVRAQGNMLSDYINIGPKDGIKMEWATNEAKGLGNDARNNAIRTLQQNITIVSPFSEDPKAADNSVDFKTNYDVGIHLVGMNFWNTNDNLKKYMTLFGKQSFAIKPPAIRYIIEVLPPPKYPQDPGWGSGVTAGTPVTPPPISLP